MNRSNRIYQLLLRFFPFDFQREYGAEMESVFHEERKHKNATRLWWRTAIGFLRSAPTEHLDVFRRDVRYGMRSLARKPLTALITFLVLAIGIGANTAVFSVMNVMLIKPLPVPYPQQVVRVTVGSEVGSVDYNEYVQFRDQNRTLSQLAAFQDKEITFRADGPAELLVATAVTGNYFETLLVSPFLGRLIQKTDDRPGAPGVVLLSEGFWRDRFGANPSVIGRTVRVDGTPFTIIGVTPESFGGADRDVSRDLWLPWNSPGQLGNAHMIGRLRQGISIHQAQADFSVIASQLKQDRSPQHRIVSVHGARMVPPVVSGRVMPLVGLFIGLVGLSLLVPCLNIGNLLLAQAAERGREMGIRLALGAGRGQLMRQLLTESLLIGVGAGIVGLGMFLGTLAILVSYFEVSPAYASRLLLDWRVAAFTLALSLVTTLMFGLAPALHSVRSDVLPALKEGESMGPITRSRLRSGLIIGQVAVSAVLLTLSGLFVRSLTSSRVSDLGLVTNGVLMGRISLTNARYRPERGVEFYEALIRNLEASSGVISANINEANGPLGAGAAKARALTTGQEAVSYSTYGVSRGHFRTLGIPLVAGRDFNAADRQGTPKVGIVNEFLARQQWPGQSPIGKTFSGVEVIGLVRDTKYLQNTDVPRQFLYLPLTQNYVPEVTLLVKANGDALSILPQVRAAVAGLDGDIPISNAMTLDVLTRMSLLPVRIVATLAAVLGVVALGLAAMGIYGTVAFSVRQRNREIGIRMAIGATASRIVRHVTRQTVRWIITGLVLGFSAAMLMSRAVAGLIYGVSATDPVTYLAVTLILGGIAYAASWLPARRASRIDPIVALREE